MTLTLLTACGGDETVYHTVTFDSAGGSVYSPREIEEGKLIIEPTVPARPGYTFVGWFVGEDEWDFATKTVTAPVTLTARWERITYTVKFNTDGADAIPDQVIASGDHVAMPAEPTKKDHRFIGWYNGYDEWIFNTDVVTASMTLTAKWEPFPTYTVTFDSDGGTSVLPQYVVEGYKVSKPQAPTKSYARFDGWYTAEGVAWIFEANTVTSNLVLKAKWIPVPTYTVTFDSNGGSAVSEQHIPEGGTATRPTTPTKQLAIFNGWFLGDTEWNFDTVVTQNITLVAKWTNRYTVTYIVDGVTVDSYVKNEQERAPRIEDPSKENFIFIGWYSGETLWNFSTPLTSDLTLTAKWEAVPTYKVTFDSDGGSAVAEQNIIEGGTVKQPADPTKSGYRFDGWYDGDDKWDFNTHAITKAVTLKAKWVETVTISFSTEYGSVAPITIDKGTLIPQPPTIESAGYALVAWLYNGEEWSFADNYANTDITLTAKWLPVYTVSFDTIGAGDIPPQYIIEGGKVAKVTTPNKGELFHHDGWYVEGDEDLWDFDNDVVTGDIVLKSQWSIMTPPHYW